MLARFTTCAFRQPGATSRQKANTVSPRSISYPLTTDDVSHGTIIVERSTSVKSRDATCKWITAREMPLLPDSEGCAIIFPSIQEHSVLSSWLPVTGAIGIGDQH